MKSKRNYMAPYVFIMFIFLTPGLQFSAQAENSLAHSAVESREIDINKWVDFFKHTLRNGDGRVYEVPGSEKLEKIEISYLNRQKTFIKNRNGIPGFQKIMGGVDTGGGTLFVKGSEVTLLDFHNFPFSAVKQPGIHLKKRTLCFAETFNIRALPFLGYLDDVLSPLIDDSLPFQYQQVLEEALQTLQFTFIDAEFSKEATDPNAFVQKADKPYLVPVAIYIKGQGVLISLPLFNNLNLRDQLGLIVHEVLRQASIGFELAISDRDLQSLTSVIMRKESLALQKKEKISSIKAKVPPNLFNGILTSHTLRADLSFLCSYLAGQGKATGPGCQSLARSNPEGIYQVLPLIRKEALQAYAHIDSGFDDTEHDASWENILTRMNSFRQLRVSSMKISNSSVFRAFSYQSLRSQTSSDVAQICSGFRRALKEEKLISN